MPWQKIPFQRPTREDRKRLFGKVRFYADQNLDASIVEVLRHYGHDVITAQEKGHHQQPDDYHYRWAHKAKRVLLTHDKDYLDHDRFPLSQTRGVIVFNVDTTDIGALARAVEVVHTILAGLGPILDECKIRLNADYTLTFYSRVPVDGYEIEPTRYKLDQNGRDIWIWESS